MSTNNRCFEQKYEKYQFFIWKFLVFGSEIFYIFEKACFRNCNSTSENGSFQKAFDVQGSKQEVTEVVSLARNNQK